MCLGALRGEHSLKVARRARAGQTFPHGPALSFFFTKLHTNCPFLASFVRVQWHVMGTILGVMSLFFQCRFSFLDVASPVWSSLRLSGLACIATWPCWPEPMCTIACFRGTKVSGFRKGLHDGSWSKCLTPTPQPRFLLLPFTPMPDGVMHQLHPFRTNG